MKLQKSKTGYYILLWLVAIIFFLPVLWIVMSAFKVPSDILAWPPKVFFKPTLDNFRDLFGREIFLNAFFKTTFIALIFASPFPAPLFPSFQTTDAK